MVEIRVVETGLAERERQETAPRLGPGHGRVVQLVVGEVDGLEVREVREVLPADVDELEPGDLRGHHELGLLLPGRRQ